MTKRFLTLALVLASFAAVAPAAAVYGRGYGYARPGVRVGVTNRALLLWTARMHGPYIFIRRAGLSGLRGSYGYGYGYGYRGYAPRYYGGGYYRGGYARGYRPVDGIQTRKEDPGGCNRAPPGLCFYSVLLLQRRRLRTPVIQPIKEQLISPMRLIPEIHLGPQQHYLPFPDRRLRDRGSSVQILLPPGPSA